MEQDAAQLIDRTALLRLKEAGFTVIRAGDQFAPAMVDPWKLAYDPVYIGTADARAYAGYIFREVAEHAQKIAIPNETDAQQVVAWLNQRNTLLDLCENWVAALQTVKDREMELALPMVELAMGM